MYKIVARGSSEGFSPWYLILGSTSTTASVLNIFTVQWNVVLCCNRVGPFTCLLSLGAILQLSLQWVLFSIIFVLFLIYYPKHLKYVRVSVGPDNPPIPTGLKAKEWRLAIVLAWVTVSHFILSLLYTIFLIATARLGPSGAYPSEQMESWAIVLGITATALATIQYMPQLVKTYKSKIVGALSIPMMCIQTPGAIIMVLSIALRKGTNWTSWIMFAVSAAMQGSLLALCFVWKVRQRRLGIDDYGVSIGHLPSAVTEAVGGEGDILPELPESSGTQGNGEGGPNNVEARRASISEQTPLLERTPTGKSHGEGINQQ